MRRRRTGRRSSTASVALAAGLALALALPGAASAARAADDVASDRTSVRFMSPETGGAGRPRFLSERQIAFFARAEAMFEGTALEPGEYPERYVRVATDRLVARTMLASLMTQRGIEPPDLPKLAVEMRADLADRLGGSAALSALMAQEGLEEPELASFLRDQVRAAWYIDRGIAPILAVTDDALREAFRATQHPYRAQKYEDARPRLKRWLVVERARVAELEFLQGARARVRITVVR